MRQKNVSKQTIFPSSAHYFSLNKPFLGSLVNINTLSLSKGSTSLTRIGAFGTFKMTIYVRVLENVFFCETKVVSKFKLVFFCETKVVSSHFGGIFFLSRVSKVKNSCFLAKIHHMLGFILNLLKLRKKFTKKLIFNFSREILLLFFRKKNQPWNSASNLQGNPCTKFF